MKPKIEGWRRREGDDDDAAEGDDDEEVGTTRDHKATKSGKDFDEFCQNFYRNNSSLVEHSHNYR